MSTCRTPVGEGRTRAERRMSLGSRESVAGLQDTLRAIEAL